MDGRYTTGRMCRAMGIAGHVNSISDVLRTFTLCTSKIVTAAVVTRTAVCGTVPAPMVVPVCVAFA